MRRIKCWNNKNNGKTTIMIQKINLNNILFLDIETVPQYDSYMGMDHETQKLWEQKTQYQRRDEVTAEDFYERAGIWANSEKSFVFRWVILPIKPISEILEPLVFGEKKRKYWKIFPIC